MNTNNGDSELLMYLKAIKVRQWFISLLLLIVSQSFIIIVYMLQESRPARNANLQAGRELSISKTTFVLVLDFIL